MLFRVYLAILSVVWSLTFPTPYIFWNVHYSSTFCQKYHEMFKNLAMECHTLGHPQYKKKWAVICMHMCAMSIFFAFFYDFVLDFGIVPTGWVFFFLLFILITLYKERIPFHFSLFFIVVFCHHVNKYIYFSVMFIRVFVNIYLFIWSIIILLFWHFHIFFLMLNCSFKQYLRHIWMLL